MTREEIVEELNRRGYKAEPDEIFKNGLKVEGIKIITDTHINPFFRIDEVLKNAEKQQLTTDIVVEALLINFEMSQKFKIDPKSFLNRQNILDNIYIGLQRVSEEELEKRPTDLEGLEKYLYVCEKRPDSGFNIVKVQRQLLQHVEISEDEAWQRAEENTNSETVIASIDELVDEPTLLERCGTTTAPFYVVTNGFGNRGAASILNRKALKDLAQRLDVNEFLAIPSSIHEMLLIPYPIDVDIDVVSEFVRTVNTLVVDPLERLTDRAYTIRI